MKSVRIRGYSGLYFPAFGRNTDQNNTEFEHFLHKEIFKSLTVETAVSEDFTVLKSYVVSAEKAVDDNRKTFAEKHSH